MYAISYVTDWWNGSMTNPERKCPAPCIIGKISAELLADGEARRRVVAGPTRGGATTQAAKRASRFIQLFAGQGTNAAID